MTWRCSKCSTEATASNADIFLRRGWRTNYPDGLLCPTCAQQRPLAPRADTLSDSDMDRQVAAQSERARARRCRPE